MSNSLRLSGTVIFVADVPSMANFYQSITGWSVLEGDASFVRLGTADQQIVIHEIRGVDEINDSTMRIATPLKTVFTATDRSILEIVSAAGGRVLTNREFTHAGRTHIDFVDPENNVMQIVFPV